MTMQFKSGPNLFAADSPKEMRFVLSPAPFEGQASIHLVRLQDTPGAKGLDGTAPIDARAHVCTVWTGRADIALDLCGRLDFALSKPVDFVFDVQELEAMCIACLTLPKYPRKTSAPRDLDEDLRTGRDAATTEDDATP